MDNLCVVAVIDPVSLMGDQVQVKFEQDHVVLARDDYYESGGCCYSVIELTRADVEQLLALFEVGVNG